MLARSHADVLSVLALNPKGLTSKEIFKAILERIKDSEITEPEQVSKINFQVRSKGLITTFDLAKEKVHVITPKGKKALEAYVEEMLSINLKATEEMETQNEAPVPSSITKAVATTETPTQNQALAKMFNQFDIDPTEYQKVLVKQAKELGLTILDPADELHAPFIAILKLIETAASVQLPTITNKTEKIDTLSRLGNLLSDDLKTMLDAIIPDLNQLEEIA